jgi:hypothetical protein
MMNKYERNFWLDLILLVIFLITLVSGILLWQKIPGSNAGAELADWMALHIVPGLLGLIGVILHIVWHWDWLKALRGRPLKSLKRPVRANRVIDRAIWFAFLSSNFFGFLSWLFPASLPGDALRIIIIFHAAAGVVWIVLLAAHLILHQKWIVSALPVHLKFFQRGV